jgi:hypothetical protein
LTLSHTTCRSGAPIRSRSSGHARASGTCTRIFPERLRARALSRDYTGAIKHGISASWANRVDFPAVLRALRESGYRNWIVVEQDVLPGMGSPAESARRNREFLRGLGI